MRASTFSAAAQTASPIAPLLSSDSIIRSAMRAQRRLNALTKQMKSCHQSDSFDEQKVLFEK
jgi:hypothetical protein